MEFIAKWYENYAERKGFQITAEGAYGSQLLVFRGFLVWLFYFKFSLILSEVYMFL